MEKRMVSMMLATSMAFLILAGCGGSGNTGAAATAEAADETETAEEKDVPEEKTAETQRRAANNSPQLTYERIHRQSNQKIRHHLLRRQWRRN